MTTEAPKLKCPKCECFDIAVARNMRSTGICKSCGHTADHAYKTFAIVPPSGKSRVDLFVRGSKESAYEAGEKLGLTGEALRQFSYLGYEHKITYEFDPASPINAVVVAIDGHPISPTGGSST